jgi:hypothetical protein
MFQERTTDMKKECLGLAVVCAMMGLTGCVSYSNSLPYGPAPLLELKTTATYDVIGDATGTATGAKLFGFIPIGGEKKSGMVGGMIQLDPVAKTAIYNAIESVPTADSLLAPRYSVKVSDYVIYTEETVTVKGKAIRYNVSGK